jgi:hypothetical protein
VKPEWVVYRVIGVVEDTLESRLVMRDPGTVVEAFTPLQPGRLSRAALLVHTPGPAELLVGAARFAVDSPGLSPSAATLSKEVAGYYERVWTPVLAMMFLGTGVDRDCSTRTRRTALVHDHAART